MSVPAPGAAPPAPPGAAAALHQALRRALLVPVDVASLVAFRVVFGALMLVAVARFFLHGWIASYYLVPQVFFPYYGLSFIRPLPGPGMYLLYGLIGLSALAILLGCCYRAATVLFFLSFTYAHLIDRTNYLNHYYLVSLLGLLLCFLPLHRAASVDAALRPRLRARTMPGWALTTLRFQVGAVYFFAGVAKLKGDWLLGGQPLRSWLGANVDFPVLGPLFDYPATAYAMSWAGAAFDLTTPFLLLRARTRPFAYAAVVLFHLTTARLFQLGLFPWIMTLLALLFFPPRWPRRLPGLGRLVARLLPEEVAAPPPPAAPLQRWQRLAFAALALHVAVQLFMPLRYHLYPGNVLWHEQGFRFAWHVMLMEKNGVADFYVVDAGGARLRVDPHRYLTRYQLKMMSSQPDMILSFAHFLRDECRRRGMGEVAVYVDAFASLNGRPPTRLVDPAVNLAAERDGVGNKRWILPAPP